MRSDLTRGKIYLILLSAICITTALFLLLHSPPRDNDGRGGQISGEEGVVLLPEPSYGGDVTVEKALLERRSVRDFDARALSLEEVSQLLWAAQGITSGPGFRTAPSAGALYPLKIYLAAGDVESLPPGVYRYSEQNHSIYRIVEGDIREKLFSAALSQSAVRNAPVTVVIAAVYERTTVKYGDRGIRYVHMEAGHVSQNIYLQAESLRLGTVAIGAFHDEDVAKVMGMERGTVPLYLMPVGHPAG